MTEEQRQDNAIGKLWGALREARAQLSGELQTIRSELYGVSGNNGHNGRLKKLEEKMEVIEKELPQTMNSIGQRYLEKFETASKQFSEYRYVHAPEIYITKKDFLDHMETCNRREDEREERERVKGKKRFDNWQGLINTGLLIAAIVTILIK